MFRSPPHCNIGSSYGQSQRPVNTPEMCFRPGSPRYHSSPRARAPNRFQSPGHNNMNHDHYHGSSFHINNSNHGDQRPPRNMYPPQNFHMRSPRGSHGHTPHSSLEHNRSWQDRNRRGNSPYHDYDDRSSTNSYGQVCSMNRFNILP